MLFDPSTEFGQRVERRLREEAIIWLTTIDSTGRPQPRPVWFIWTGQDFIIYTRPEGRKLSHIQNNPHVALHFDGDGRGGNIIVFLGEAQVEQGQPPADAAAAYVEKYREGMKRLGMDPARFTSEYSLTIRVRPVKLRGF
jgi:PPOX class probable F420-dependent enzyme